MPHSSTIIAAANDHERHVHLAEVASSKGDLSLFWHHARMASAAARTFELVTRKRLGGDGEKASGTGSDNNIEKSDSRPLAGAEDGQNAGYSPAPKRATIESSAPRGPS